MDIKHPLTWLTYLTRCAKKAKTSTNLLRSSCYRDVFLMPSMTTTLTKRGTIASTSIKSWTEEKARIDAAGTQLGRLTASLMSET